MTHCSYITSARLKLAGLPQPEKRVDQIWYDTFGNASLLAEKMDNFFEVFLHGSTQVYEVSDFYGWVFAPTLEYITERLSPGFSLSMWGGECSCSNGDEEAPMRTFGQNFTEAAAIMWLEYAAIL